jgi:hypothetical protein
VPPCQPIRDGLDRVNKRTHLSTNTETTATYLTRWLAGKSGLRPSTRRSYEAHVRLYLIPGIGHLRLGDLSVEDVEELYDALRKLGRTRKGSAMLARLLDARHPSSGAHQLTDASIRRVHATLMSALNTAAKRRLIPFNPASFVELASGKRPRAVLWTDERVADWRRTGKRPKVAVWPPEQTGAFLDHASADRLYALCHLLTFRGLRRGEAVGLPWAEVDLAGRSLMVNEQIVQLGYRHRNGSTQERNSRLVALDEGSIAVFRAHRARQSAERRTRGSTWAESGLVFTREYGCRCAPGIRHPPLRAPGP